MVLEPLSAFAVACNVLQVAEYGWKVLRKAIKCHNASQGLPHEQVEIQNIYQHLENLIKELENVSDGTAVQESIPRSQLRIANEDCSKSARDFVTFLDRLKARQRQGRLQSLVQAFKLHFHNEEMQVLENRIAQSRSNLILAFLVYMEYKQTRRDQQNDPLQVSSSTERNILNSIEATYLPLREDVEGIARKLQTLSLEHLHDQSSNAKEELKVAARQQIIDCFQIDHDRALKGLFGTLANLISEHNAIHWMSYDQQVAEAQQGLLDSLHFGDLEARREQISTAYANTFRWIWRSSKDDSDDSHSDSSRHTANFNSWLNSCTEDILGIYWISGKPGSGKSTLMRHIDQTVDQNSHCSQWSLEREMLKVSWFFWNPGSRVQRSFIGLLRSLVYQLLKARPGLIGHAIPAEWRASPSVDNLCRDWTVQELKSTLRNICLKICDADRILMIVDGLDELEGPDELRQEMLDMFQELAHLEGLKLILASRPWLIFSDVLLEGPHLRLEMLTRGDITEYVSGRLHTDKNYCNMKRINAATALELVDKVVSKAEGVFLWVRLVIRDLLRGLRDGDTFARLQEKLDNIPADLDEYFHRILDSVDVDYRKEASVLIQLVLHEFDEHGINTRTRTLLDLSLIVELGPVFALDAKFDFESLEIRSCPSFKHRLERMSRRLKSRCMGLLESSAPRRITRVHEHADCGSLAPRVDFLHRCCRDYLRTDYAQSLLYQYSDGPYDASIGLCNAMLAEAMAFSLNWAHLRTTSPAHDISYEMEDGPLCSTTNDAVCSAIMYNEMDHLLKRLSQAGGKGATVCERFAESISRLVVSFHDRPQEHIDIQIAPHHLQVCLESLDPHASFLIPAIAVAYGWMGYLTRHLASGAIKDSGHALLVWTLDMAYDTHSRGNRGNSIEVLELLLEQGVSPNLRHGDSTVWANWISKLCQQPSFSVTTGLYRVTKLLIQHGAEEDIPWACLEDKATWSKNGLKPFGTSSGEYFVVADLLEHSVLSRAEIEKLQNLLGRPQKMDSAKGPAKQSSKRRRSAKRYRESKRARRDIEWEADVLLLSEATDVESDNDSLSDI